MFVSFIGLWANFWFYRDFKLPILEYMQGSDYLVAGLRDPAYGLILLAGVLLVFLVTWPDAWRRNHPERVEQLRRRWWGRVVFPNARLLRWKGVGMTPETGMVFAAFWFTVWAAASYVNAKATYIRDDGSGQPVQVTLAGAAAPMPGQARLLGTSSAFVFLWWPDKRRAEAVPIEGIGRVQTLPMSVPQLREPAQGTAAPAPSVVPAKAAPTKAAKPPSAPATQL